MPADKTQPPGPDSGFLGWRHMAAVRDDLIGFGARNRDAYGDVVHFRLGPLHCYQFTHPDHVHEALVLKAKRLRKPARLRQVFGRFEGNGLVLSEGETWARQRRLVQPAFQPERLRAYAGVITTLAAEMLNGWGAEVEVAAAMRALTLRVVTRALFSAGVDDAVEELGRAVAVIQDWAMREMNRLAVTPRWLPLIGQPAARRAIALIDGLVRRIIRERRAGGAGGAGGDDLLGRLLGAVDAEGDGRGMTDRQLRDEMVTMLLAGHETSAAALTWALWLLARHPDAQEELAADARAALGGRTPDFADLPRLGAAARAFKEAMRLYPPVYFLSREVAAPVVIAGYALAPGSQVFVYPYLTHRDARWFPDPERFRPERFAPADEERLPPCAWFPFGAGPRACVGRGFAMMEGTLVLAMVVQRYRLEVAPDQDEPEPAWQLSLHPRGGIRLAVSPRSSPPRPVVGPRDAGPGP